MASMLPSPMTSTRYKNGRHIIILLQFGMLLFLSQYTSAEQIQSQRQLFSASSASSKSDNSHEVPIPSTKSDGPISASSSSTITTTIQHENLLNDSRSLRGGSYSRGSWSSSSSGSRYSYNRNSGGGGGSSSYWGNRRNNNGNRRSGFGRFFGGLALGLGLLFFMGAACLGPAAFASGCGTCLAALCCGAGLAGAGAAASASRRGGGYMNSYSNASSGGYMNPFEQRVEKIKEEVNASSSSGPFWGNGAGGQQVNIYPYSGQYVAAFIDPETQVHHSAMINLSFQKDTTNSYSNSGYFLTGHGSDVDGKTIIEEGYAYSNGMAWWIERTVSDGDIGLVVISRGRFDYGQRTFEGMWLANTMLEAPYTSFSASGVSASGNNNTGTNTFPVVGMGNNNMMGPHGNGGVSANTFSNAGNATTGQMVTVSGTPVGDPNHPVSGMPVAPGNQQNIVTVVGQPVLS